MTNEQKYKTAEERAKEFLSQREVSSIATVVANEFAHWLALEAETVASLGCATTTNAKRKAR